MKQSRHKTFILGIDGATFDVILPLIRKNKLPNMRHIIDNGVHGQLRSTIPPLSAPAWIAFMTGKNPGNYGAYHFRDIDIGSPQRLNDIDLVNSSVYSGDTFFDYLGEIGYRVGLITIPVTYPPWKVNGFLISGYPCPDPAQNANFTYPAPLAREITENLNWTEDVSSELISKEELRGAHHPDEVLNGGLNMMTRRTNYALELMARYRCDVTVLVWGAIDRAQHVLWKYYDPHHPLFESGNKFHDYIERLYCHADQLLGRILNQIDKNDSLFIVSDHGFGPRKGTFFHLNAWLNQEGYLKTNLKEQIRNHSIINPLKPILRRLAQTLNSKTQKRLFKANLSMAAGGVNLQKTRAYMYPIHEQTIGLVINLKERYPTGSVPKKDYEGLRTELMHQLRSIADPKSGKPIVKAIYKREELYRGSKTRKAPDIIILLEDDYFGGTRASNKIFTTINKDNNRTINGSHRQNGIFIASGQNINKAKKLENADIKDIAPTVIYSCNEKIPIDIEGKVLTSIFIDESTGADIRYTDRKVKVIKDLAQLTKGEKDSMISKLKQLGYL